MRRRPATIERFTVIMWLGAGACAGQIGSDPEDPATAPSPAGSAPAGRPATGGAAPAGGQAASPAPAPPAGTLPGVPLRRLTNREYLATLRDLLAIQLPPLELLPEERVDGFDNNAAALTVSPVLAEQYLMAAESAARLAGANLAAVAPCATAATDACAAEIAGTLGKRAWRRPLSPDEVATLVRLYQSGKGQGGFRAGVELVIRALLFSPNFLFRVEVGVPAEGRPGLLRPTSWEMATRLSYFLWGTMPDGVLFDTAEKDALRTAAQVRAQAERMLQDRRARGATASFLEQWLDLDQIGKEAKDEKVFPKLTAPMAPLLRKEADAFLEHAVWQGDVRSLFTASESFLNAKLAAYYGVAGPRGETLERAPLDAPRRAGVVTLGGVLSMLAGPEQTAPTLRGLFVREKLLCERMPPPPPTVNNNRPPPVRTSTTRERIAQHAKDPSCAGCHQLIDPIGFGLEKFDGAGLYRETDGGKPIDDAGEVVGHEIGRFRGAAELGQKLAASRSTGACLARQWFRFGTGRTEATDDEPTLTWLAGELSPTAPIRGLLAALTQTDAFLYRPVTP
jgi:hypothetical protein